MDLQTPHNRFGISYLCGEPQKNLIMLWTVGETVFFHLK